MIGSFNTIIARQLMSAIPKDDRLTQFSNYIVNTYISFADFPPNIWLSASIDLAQTTVNRSVVI